MPLDVQPLSPTRRAIMVGVMFLLLAASLGFAELLVRHRILHPAGALVFPLPPNATTPLVVNKDLRKLGTGRPKVCRLSPTAAGPRQYILFALPVFAAGELPEDQYLRIVFGTIASEGPL